MIRNGQIQGEVHQQVTLPKIEKHAEVALIYGFNLELEDSVVSLPGSYVREVFFSSKPQSFDQAFELRHMEKVYSKEVHAYYPLKNPKRQGNKYSFLSSQSVPNVAIELLKAGANNDVCRFGTQGDNYLWVNSFDFFDSLTLAGSSRRKTDYEYSLQVWLKIAPDTKTEDLASQAVRYAYVLKHDQVFALYLSAPNQLRLYLFAQKPYFEKSSKPVFVPYNEWVHIRLRINMSKGYILEVYS
jgi:hypothetical protein